MFETHIYIETDNLSPKSTEKYYGYVLECRRSGNIGTKEGFGKITATYHQAVLAAVIEALYRFRQSCEVYIHTRNIYILNMIETNLTKWASNGFVSSKGRPVANQEMWKELYRLSQKHLILVEPGEHTYSHWLRSEIIKRKGKDNV